MSWRGVGKIDKIRGLPQGGGTPRKEKDLGGVSLARDRADTLDEEFRAAVDVVGEEAAQEAQGIRRRGSTGTLPELLTESWLLRRKVPFIKQVTLPEAHARVDFVVRDELAWRINGEIFHPPADPGDKAQRYALGLMGFRVVDISELAIYHAREYALSSALRGREIGRAFTRINIQRGVTRRL